GKACRIRKTDDESGRAIGANTSRLILSAPKLGIRSGGGGESVAKSDRDRFQNQSQASDAAGLRRGKSDTNPGRPFSRTQGKGARCDQGGLKVRSGRSRSQHFGRIRG